jgi:multidrug resistance efflux pump
MSTTSKQPALTASPDLAPPPGWSPWRTLLLGCVLALAAVGASWALLLWYSPTLLSFSSETAADLAPPVDDNLVAACLGYVDGEDGVTSLTPVQPGRVEQILVREGDTVSADAVLLRLDAGPQRLRVEEAQTALEGVRIQLAQVQQQAGQHKTRLAQQQAAVDALAARVAAAREQLARQKQLQESRLGDTREVRIAAEQVKEAEALERVEKERLTLLKQQDPALEIQRAEAEVALQEVRLKQARHALAECDLKAPRAGTVLRIRVRAGDLVGGLPGEPAVLFMPEGPRIVRAEVEQEFARNLAVGQPALIEDETHPETTWRGRVVRIADFFTHRRQVLREPVLHHDVRTVECVLALDPDQPPPRLGLRVQVTLRRIEK